MADTYDTQDVAPEGYGVPRADLGGTLRVATNLIGAAISLGLVIGVAVWGYKLLVRDVSGIPVVRALEGPMRVQPENPGGDAADHQGLAVNAVAAEGTAAPPADRLVLAPRPVALTDEDLPRADIARPAETPGATDPSPTQSAEIDDLIAQLVAPREGGAGPIVQPAPLVLRDVTEEAPAAAPAAAIPADAPGLARSLRPRPRPDAATIAATTAAGGPDRVIAASAPADIDIAPEDVPVGTRVVQFGAYDTPDVARAEWDRLNARFGDYLAGKRRIIQQASSGGRTFYRLRALGFTDLSDARRFCSALVAEGADCIPVVTR